LENFLDSLKTDKELYKLLYPDKCIVENKKDPIVLRGEQCEKCDSLNILNDTERGIKVCIDCGTVVGETFDNSSEWRSYSDGGDKNNVRCNYLTNRLLPQSTLGTQIAGKGGGLIRKLHLWSAVPYKERKLKKKFEKIDTICKTYNIPGYIADDARILYKNVNDGKYSEGLVTILRGPNEKGLVGACLFYACKKKGYALNTKEIAKMFGITKTKMSGGCKMYKQLLKMTYDTENNNPNHFFQRSLEKLDLLQYYDDCVMVSNNISKLNISSRQNPLSTVCAIILLVVEIKDVLNVTSEDIAKTLQVSRATVEKSYGVIEKFKNIVSDTKEVDKILEKYGNAKCSDAKYSMPEKFTKNYLNLVANYDKYIDEGEDVIMYSNPANYTKKVTMEISRKICKKI
jgi:transcription initiation factor TFIIB